MNNTLTLAGGIPLAPVTRSVLRLLEGLQEGMLELRLPDGATLNFGNGVPGVALQVNDEAMFDRVLARGDIGFAEAYLDGQWDAPDLAGLLALLAKNRAGLARAIYGNWRGLLAARLRHLFNRNSRAGSKRNIMAHYDLGNDFYRAWLDDSMSYSSALFSSAADTLESAQLAKYRRILDRLQARPGERILEIGCGWGGFAVVANQFGLQLTGLTLSPAQMDWARQRAPGADLRLQDYRDIDEKYDHIVSIEMFEAVGERWWATYFGTVAKALKPDGRTIIQTITIRDDLFADYRKGTDFIKQYIFPGGMLPSKCAFRCEAERQGLVVRDEFAFGRDYARTLALWREAFEAHWPRIAALGFDERFRRLWRFYLAYCEAGFRAGTIDVVQFELGHRAQRPT